jgi:hypothetical protein
MNQYPLYLRIETKRNLFFVESITIHKNQLHADFKEDSLVTEISGMQSRENWVLKNMLCLELNKHLLHIIETASWIQRGRFFL